MNWLAHVFLSPCLFEDRLGNIIADLIKGKQRKSLSPIFDKGIECHLLIDSFTDRHPVFKQSKKRIIVEQKRYSGILIDVFYDHLLARNWHLYSQISLGEFTTEVYESFLNNLDKIPPTIVTNIKRIVDEDLLGSYYHIAGIEKTLIRIKRRLSTKHNHNFDVDQAMKQLQDDYSNFNQEFNLFFPEIIEHIEHNLD